MNKSTATPKELLKKRIAENKKLRVEKDVCNRKHDEKGREPMRVVHKYKKPIIGTRHKELKDEAYPNPYAIPEQMRVSTKCLPPRKKKATPIVLDDIHTVCDIDPTFYTIVEGRPIRSFYDIKRYMKDLRDITLMRASAGYLKEQVIQKDTAIAEEEEEYQKIDDLLEKTASNFRKFADQTFEEARHMQKLAMAKNQELALVLEQLEGYYFEYIRLKNQIYYKVSIYETLLKYKGFLSLLSPLSWRERHQGSCRVGNTLCSTLFEQLESDSTESVTMFKKSVFSKAKPPHLYFKHPSQIMNSFDAIARQCLHYLQFITYSTSVVKKVVEDKKEYYKIMEKQYSQMQDLVEMFEYKVKFYNETADAYKAAFFRILGHGFYDLVASYDSVKLFTCVQYAHAKIFSTEEDPRDKLRTLMLNIERLYLDLYDKIDCLNVKVVKVATKQIFDEDKENMRKAHEAQRYLKAYDVLAKSLQKCFEPSAKKTR